MKSESLCWRYLKLLASVIVLLILTPLLFASQPPSGNRPALKRKGREIVALDGYWQFLTDLDASGERKDWQKTIPANTKPVTVPGQWDQFAMSPYSGVGWYWQEFDISKKWKGQTVRLRFEGVTETSKVWINGKFIGESNRPVTPFEYNITESLNVGKRNLIAVQVKGESKKGAGIWQSVLLFAHDEAFISDCFPQGSKNGNVTAVVTLINLAKYPGDAILDARIVASQAPKRILKETRQILSITPERNITTMLTALPPKSIKLWSPEQPYLYLFQLSFRQEIDILDTQQTAFGFREFGYENGAITLNGKALTLKPLAPKTELPIVLATLEDTQRARELFQKMKERGVNLLYLEAPTPLLLQLADEIGLLIVVTPRSTLPASIATGEIRELILRDRAHPSILGWKIGAADSETVKMLSALDPTRFLFGTFEGVPVLYPPGKLEAAKMIPPSYLPASKTD